MRLQTLNPVLDRELRQRSRSMRSMVLLTLFLALTIGVMYLAYKGSQATSNFSNDPISALTVRTGRSMFEWVLVTELVIVLTVVPAISAGTIAGERDRQTLIPLQVTLIGPVQIFLGKVLASSSFLLLMLIGSAPVLAVPYLVGGISLTQVLVSLLTLLVTGFLLTVVGVGCSSLFRRTQTATLASYAVVLVLLFGTVILFAVSAIFFADDNNRRAEANFAPLYANPFVAVADAAGDLGTQADSPFSSIQRAFVRSRFDGDVIVEDGFAFNARTGEEVDLPTGLDGLPLWARSLLAQGTIAAFFAFIGIRRLRAPGKEMTG